jgi:hypothetical protein
MPSDISFLEFASDPDQSCNSSKVLGDIKDENIAP